MYGWGGSTTGWKKPGKFAFDPARKPYLDKLASAAAAKGPRAYAMSGTPDMALVDPRGKTISSASTDPIIIGVDVTGSMAAAPGEFFDRAPLLYQTLSQYRPNAEFSFGAIGDAYCDSYPLQVNKFAKGLDLEAHLKAIGCEGGGGGQIMESYELFGYFMLKHCDVPNAVSPFLFIFGDEKAHPAVDPDQVKHYIGDTLESAMEPKALWTALKQKFNVFYIHKPYGGGGEAGITKEVGSYWIDMLGRERVIPLPTKDKEGNPIDPLERSVDVIMGIVAKTWGQYGDFSKNLDARQDSAVAASVHASLRYLPAATSTKSSLATGAVDGKSESLFDIDPAGPAGPAPYASQGTSGMIGPAPAPAGSKRGSKRK